MTIEVYVDGLCEPRNPGGTAAYGFIVLKGGGVVASEGRVIGHGRGMSNNVAEYSAVCAAMRWLLDHNLVSEELVFKTDSQLVANQMSGRWGVHGGLYLPYYLDAADLVKQFRHIRFVWVPREENEAADGLSKDAYEMWCGDSGRAHSTAVAKRGGE